MRRLGLDEIYTYDGLNRLTGTQRGTLASGVLTNETAEQSWTLSATGNWEQFTHDTDGDGTNEKGETRTYNNANEITDISTATAIDPVYDAAGNMTRLPSPADNTAGQLAVYDAWGRLVKIYDDANADGLATTDELVASYEYDGQKRRIEKTLGTATQDYFYNTNWQLLETRLADDTDPQTQYIWGLNYIDSPVLRFQDTDTDGTLEIR